jgi:multiple sugar transport system permease protein
MGLAARLKKNNIAAGYMFIGLYVIGFFSFVLFPFLYSFYLALTDYDVLTPARWVGVDNFVKMFTADDLFWKSFFVTVKFAVVQVPLKLLVSLLVALALSKATKLTGVYRVVYYMPSIVGGSVAVAMTWKQLWDNSGLVNSLLGQLGIPAVRWLSNERTAIYVLILLGVWQFGASMLIFLAGIKNVPASLHEAAIVDGAGPVKRFFAITLPMITSSIFFNLINGIIGSLQAFNSSYLITSGRPLNSTLYYGLQMYRQAFDHFKMGYASAMAWFMFVIIVALTVAVFRSSSAWVFYQDEGR